MTIQKSDFASILVIGTVFGTERAYLLPNLDGDKAKGELKAIWGDMKAVLNDEANMKVLLSDPAELPEVNGALEEACVQLTFRALAAAIQAGLELPEGTDTSTKEGWNTSVNSLNEWLTPEEVTPAVEVEAEPLTQAETEAVVEALAETPQGEVALENAVAIAEEQTGLVMNEQDAIAFLSGQQILNAQKTSRQMVGVAEQKVADAVEALLDAAKLLKGSGALSDAIIAKLETPLLEEVTEDAEEVTA